MKRFSEQLHKKSTTVSLRAAEKRALRERVVSYMEYHPLPTEMKKKRVFADASALTEDYRTIRIPLTWFARVAAGMAMVVFVIVPVLAERAVPGDSLYAVKVRFNEEVRSTLSFSTSEKVVWETERLNRRIAEARLLASEGKLTEEVEADVAAAVRTHADEAQRNIAILRSVDADEATLASIAFETTLEVQSASLRAPSAPEDGAMLMAAARMIDEEETHEQTDLLNSALQDSLANNSASNASSTLPGFERTMARVEQNTTRIYELLDSIEGVTAKEQHADVTRRAEDIERAIGEVVALHQQDDTAGRQALVAVLQRTQRLIVYMTDVADTNAVDLESIVPVVLTDVEEESAINEYRATIAEQIAQLEIALTGEPNEEIADKAQAVLETLRVYHDDANESSDYDEVRAVAEAADAITKDIFMLLTILPPVVDLISIPASSTSTKTDTGTTTATSTEATASSTNQVDV